MWESLVGGALGGVLDIFGQVQSRRETKDAMYHTQQWQTDMANTAYQRAVADMRAAGLNPMLAYSQGGAATPGGGSPSFQAADYGKGISSALQARAITAQAEAAEAQPALVNAQAMKAAAETRATLASAQQTEKLTDLIVRRMGYQADQDEEDWWNRKQRALADQHGFKLRANELDRDNWYTEAYRKKGGLLDSELADAAAEAYLKQLRVPGAENEAEVDRSDYGKDRPYIHDAAAVAGGVSSAAAASVMLKNLFAKPRVYSGVRQGPSHKGSWRNGRESRMDELENKFLSR